MSATPTSHSPDLAKLEADGFRLRIIQGKAANHLLVEGVPAVTAEGKVVLGTLYCPLETDSDGKTVNPCPNHQCWWMGEPPCDATGRVMMEMVAGIGREDKGDGITTDVAFSRVHGDRRKYADYHEKIWTYVRMIWHEARAIDQSCDPRSEKPVPAVVEAQKRVFRYPDMATTRAGIGAVTAKLLGQRVAVIGLGGTGAYILDLIAKTPVDEIHIFDGDTFSLHNAFRAPGAPDKEDLREPLKVDWFGTIYERMHTGIVRHPYYIDESRLPELAGLSFVFVAIDDANARGVILKALITMGVPFIDVGMDLSIDKQNSLRGMCRFTVGTPASHSHVERVVSFGNGPDDGVYRNIQVADLNMLNAAMAVGKWKQLCGFYANDSREHHSLYTVATHALSKEDRS